ncbi:MAG TPA: alanine dehydrogenase [Desulfomonilaceae bacterium]|nr:alanine dehydrogenase [Desulfomonilaceae bacterium]
MIIGIPKEIKEDEYRVGIVPAGVATLAAHGHRILIQKTAGEGCRISDREYSDAGAILVDSAEEVYGGADMIMKVKEPLKQEYPLLRAGQILFAYLHLAPAAELTAALLEHQVIAIAYETIQLEDGSLPLLAPMSEVAGRMAVQIGAHFLEKTQGGRGVLLGGVPGVGRGRVSIIGAGTVGRASNKIAVGMGAEVIVLDTDQRRLEYLDDIFGNRVTTLISTRDAIFSSVTRSHLVIGSVLIPGARAPRLVTRDMIAAMKAGSVIVDVSIDQGGCVETSRPTTHQHPTYLVDEVIHYCVPNMPGIVARTSTFALTNITLPYAVTLGDQGVEKAVIQDKALAEGVNCYRGLVTHERVAQALGYGYTALSDVL